MSPRNLTTILDLKRDSHNPRKHGERNLQQIEQSLKNFGAGRSIVIDETNQILAGNGLVEAAGNIGLSKLVVVDATGDEIVAVRRRGLTEKQKSEYRIADNRSAELAEWDIETLEAMSQEIDLEQFWDVGELEELLGREPKEIDAEPQVDRAAELLEKWKVERGQVWQLGDHRLMCGDASNLEDLSELTGAEKCDTVVSDPPYGIAFDTDYRRFTGGAKVGTNHKPIANDDVPFDPSAYLNFEHVVLWGANFFADKLPRGTWLVWDKRFLNGTAFLSDAEIAWMKSGSGVYIFSKTSQGFVRPERVEHPTQKPVAVMVWSIEKCKAGEIVLDPFAGSGTTLIAAEQLNRRCFAMEIEPKYVAVCLQRFLDATEKQPTLSK